MKAIVKYNEPIEIIDYEDDHMPKPSVAVIQGIVVLIAAGFIDNVTHCIYTVPTVIFLVAILLGKSFSHYSDPEETTYLPLELKDIFNTPEWQARIADHIADQSGEVRSIKGKFKKDIQHEIASYFRRQSQLEHEHQKQQAQLTSNALNEWVDDIRNYKKEDLF